MKFMTRFFGFVSVCILIVFAACEQRKPDEITIAIIQTTDVHGAVFSWDFIEDHKKKGSLEQVYNYVLKEKGKKEQEVILIDNGDILQGQPTVYYSNFVDTNTQHICSRVMNFMKYDAATVGNHDIETGHAVYDKFYSELDFPLLAANAVRNENGKPYFKPYTIINKKGFKIAVLGLVTPGIPNWLPENLWEGMHFDGMLETAQKWMPIIQEKEKPDAVIGLFHAGYDYSYNKGDASDPMNENASVIVAEQVPGFDMIMIGHDHQYHNKWLVNIAGDSVLVLDPKSSAAYVAQGKIKFIKDPQGKYVKKVSGEIVDLRNEPSNVDFQNKFKEDYLNVKNYVATSLGEFNKSIYAHTSIYGPSEFTDLINSIQLELSGADISFTAPLSKIAIIEKGAIYVRDMFKLYRYENLLYTMELSGDEIDEFLEYSYANWYDNIKSGHLLKFKYDTNGNIALNRSDLPVTSTNYYNFDVAAGIIYTVDVSKPEGDRVEITSLSNGVDFELQKKYKVAVNSYRGNGGGGHLTKGIGLTKEEIKTRILHSSDIDLRYYMMQWIMENGNVNPVSLNNWKVLPEEWFLKASKKDSVLFLQEND